MHEHLVPRGPWEVSVLVMRPLGEQKMDVAERVQHRKRVGDHRRVVVLLVEDRRAVQQCVEGLDESRPWIRGAGVRRAAAVERQAVLVVVLVHPARDG